MYMCVYIRVLGNCTEEKVGSRYLKYILLKCKYWKEEKARYIYIM